MLVAAHQPTAWPTIWATEAETDLHTRLSRLPFYAPNGFGGVVEDLQTLMAKGPALLAKGIQIIDKAGPHLDTILAVVQDPALPQVIGRVKTLRSLAAAKAVPAAPGAAPTAPSADTGIKKLLPAFDAAIFLDKHPAAQFVLKHPVLVGAGAFLVLTGIGFGIGRLTKRCRTAAVGRHYRRY